MYFSKNLIYCKQGIICCQNNLAIRINNEIIWVLFGYVLFLRYYDIW